MPEFVSGYTKVHNQLVNQFDVEEDVATKSIDTYMNTERESISDNISTEDVEEVAEFIFHNYYAN